MAPLLAAAESELEYLEELEASLVQLGEWREEADTKALMEVQVSLHMLLVSTQLGMFFFWGGGSDVVSGHTR